jgi:uncharacterized protein YggT (Ycf19 family)
MALGIDTTKWKNDLARGHSATWLATAITIWAIFIILLSWYLVANENKSTVYLLAVILLYEVLP